MPGGAVFIAVDPGKSHRRARDNRVTCHICFQPFDSVQALRNHTAIFQLELQQIAARLLEVQAHLLPKRIDRAECAHACHHKINDVCGDDITDSDENDDSDDGVDSDIGDDTDDSDHSDDDRDDGNNNEGIRKGDGVHGACSSTDVDAAALVCSSPRCRRKKAFGDKSGLVRHYQLHVSCYEMCVFCRRPYETVRQFLRHKCKVRRKVNDQAKEFYRTERRTQVKKYAIQRLDRMIAKRKKRKLELGDAYPDPRVCKKRKNDAAREPATSDPYASVTMRSDATITTQRPSFSSLSRSTGVANLAHNLPSAELLPNMQFSHTQTDLHHHLQAQPYAPIFDDITITPCYDSVREPYMLPLSIENAAYPTMFSLDDGMVWPTSGTR